MRRRLAALALVVAGVGGLLLTGAGPASAHASLVSSDPADGARLDAPPAVVRLVFSEPVSADLGGLQVVDVDGGRVDEGAVQAVGAVVEVGLRPDLPDGTYVVTYRIVSADGHPVKGGLVFSVGDEAADPGALDRFFDARGDRPWELAGAVARTIGYAGTLVAAGGAIFLSVVHRAGAERPALVRTVRGAALAGAAGLLTGLPIAAALGTGRGLGAVDESGVLRAVLRDGVGLGVALALGALAALWLGLQRWRLVALAGAGVAAVSFAASGHTRATEPVWLSTLTDGAHLLAAAIWLGGLVLLWRTVRLRRAADADHAVTAAVVSRFSTLAAGSLVAVAALGSVLAWREVRALDALRSTTYGLVLLGKVGVVGAVAAVALYNRVRLVPALNAGRANAALRQLRHTLRLEAGGLLLAVAITAALVNITPGRVDAGLDGGVVEAEIDLGAVGSAQLLVDPGKAGRNQIHISTFDPSGRPADLGESVTVDLSLPASGIGPIARAPYRAGPAHFTLPDADLVPGGRWTIELHVRLDRFSEATGTTEVEVGR